MAKYIQMLETLQKIKRAEERLKILLENKSALEQKVREKKQILEKEEYDVEKLEGLSLIGIIHLLKGTLIDKFDQEEREAMIAKNQYEFAVEELNVCLREIERARERIMDKPAIERSYDEYLRNQEAKLTAENTELSLKIKRLTEDHYYHSEIIREIREAEEAGRHLLELFESIVDSIENVDNLGIIDILESGLLVSESAHETVRSTNEKLMLMQQAIRKYQLELDDVLACCQVSIDCHVFVSFSDTFLVGVIQRKSLEEKLDFAKRLMAQMVEDIRNSLNVLKQKRNSVENRRQLIKTEKIKYIESALEIE